MTLPADLGPLITSRSNARVRRLRAALSGVSACSGDLAGLEGWRLLREAQRSGVSFDTVFLRAGSEPLLDAIHTGSLRTREWARLSPEIFDAAVSTGSPQGIAATFVLRDPVLPRSLKGNVLVVEDLQDPGNLGTLLRSTDAFGGELLMATPSTVNQWNPKVMRASAGSVFRIPLRRAPMGELAAELRQQGVRLFAAVCGFTGEHHRAAPNGVITGRVDRVTSAESCHTDVGERAGSLDGYVASLSYDTDLLPPCAILIGNEGAGLSNEALTLADERIEIPCAVESLNAAVAGSILLYEAMRQLPLRQWARQQGLRP